MVRIRLRQNSNSAFRLLIRLNWFFTQFQTGSYLVKLGVQFWLFEFSARLLLSIWLFLRKKDVDSAVWQHCITTIAVKCVFPPIDRSTKPGMRKVTKHTHTHFRRTTHMADKVFAASQDISFVSSAGRPEQLKWRRQKPLAGIIALASLCFASVIALPYFFDGFSTNLMLPIILWRIFIHCSDCITSLTTPLVFLQRFVFELTHMLK